jgi:hypothetical protein
MIRDPAMRAGEMPAIEIRLGGDGFLPPLFGGASEPPPGHADVDPA